MKKALYLLLLIGLLLTSFQVASHFFRYDLYDFAIAFESEKAGLDSNQQTVDRQDYFYLSRHSPSSTETVILLHGFSANKDNWLRFSQHIPNKFAIYALDLLGHGQHPIDLATNYSIETQVAYLHNFIESNIKTPVHLIGNSMGGAIAALYAATYPDHVKTLMLISPAGVHDIPSELDKALEQGKNPLIATNSDEFFKVIDFVMEDKPFIPKSILTVQAEQSVKRMALNQKIFNDIRNDLNKQLDQNFSLITAPSLILWGQEDRAINPKNIDKYVALVKHAKPIVLEGIGHLAMIEAPKVTAESFISFTSSSDH